MPKKNSSILDGDTIASFSSLYLNIQAKIKELEGEKATIKEALFKHFDSTEGKEQPAIIDCGDGFAFSRERRSSKSIDERKLESSLDPAVWKKITVTKRELSELKLKKALSQGIVEPEYIKSAIVEKVSFAFTHPSSKQK